MKSLGLVEVQSTTAAIDCLDLMCKAADVDFVTWERKLGGRLVTVIVEGQVSAVTAAGGGASDHDFCHIIRQAFYNDSILCHPFILSISMETVLSPIAPTSVKPSTYIFTFGI